MTTLQIARKENPVALAGVALFIGCACVAPAVAHAAGGLGLMEIGTSDLGLAGAGYAARAQDAATAFTNPAGMTRIKGNDFVLGAQLLYGDVKFSPNANTTTTGNDGGNPVGWFPGGSAFYVYSLSDDVKFGIGTAGNFGLAADWGDGWVGRYYTQKATMLGMTILPSVAFRATDKLSLSVGLNAMYGYLNATTMINNVLPVGIGDGQLKYKDEVWGFGGTLGLMYEPSPQTRFGATYTSQIKLDFKANPQFSNLGTIGTALQTAGLRSGQLQINVTVPQAVMTSSYHELDARWAILGNLGWTEWSKFGDVNLAVTTNPPASLNTQSKFKDTWHAALGAQYKYSDPWLLSGGVAYDSSMVDDVNRSIGLPVGSTWAFALGARYKVRTGFDVNFAYELKYAGDLPVDNNRGALAERVAGSYNNTVLNFFGATFHWSY
jgi:long-chain fatty acid transport protein